MASPMTRESWFGNLAELFKPQFEQLGSPLPEKLRISTGFPSQRPLAQARRTIGECWPISASADGYIEIFISPVLSNSIEVGATVLHELVHAAIGTKYGHQSPFRRVALGIGLRGPMRSTHAGDELRERLNAVIAELGPYPHGKLNAHQRKKQGTRLLKVECRRCDYNVRMTRKWLAVGTPICPCGERMIPAWH